jgi:hypothetical protein
MGQERRDPEPTDKRAGLSWNMAEILDRIEVEQARIRGRQNSIRAKQGELEQRVAAIEAALSVGSRGEGDG